MEKCLILVVDDEKAICSLVAQMLGRCGYTVVTEQSGAACLTRLRAGFRGLVLMDIAMPEMNGWETIHHIVDEGLAEKNIICMMTGLAQPGSDGEGLEEHVMDYLVKPLRVGLLLEVARRASDALSA